MVFSPQFSPLLMLLVKASLTSFSIAFMMELGAPSNAASPLSGILKMFAFTHTSHSWMSLNKAARIANIMK